MYDTARDGFFKVSLRLVLLLVGTLSFWYFLAMLPQQGFWGSFLAPGVATTTDQLSPFLFGVAWLALVTAGMRWELEERQGPWLKRSLLGQLGLVALSVGLGTAGSLLDILASHFAAPFAFYAWTAVGATTTLAAGRLFRDLYWPSAER